MKYAARNAVQVPTEGLEFFVDPLDQIWVYASSNDAQFQFGTREKATGDPIVVPAGEDRSLSELAPAGLSFVRISNVDDASPATIYCILIGKG